jgi:uncharacterized coiled-coil protein SlyX
MNDNGLSALAAALRRFPVPETMEELKAATERTYESDAAAILGEHGVFLPDGTHKAWTALAEQTDTLIDLNGRLYEAESTIANLRAALEEARLELMQDVDPDAVITAIEAALATAKGAGK